MKTLKDCKMLETKAIAKLAASALQEEIARMQKAYFLLRMQKHTGELTSPHLLRFVRRYIAKLKTFQS